MSPDKRHLALGSASLTENLKIISLNDLSEVIIILKQVFLLNWLKIHTVYREIMN